MPRGSVSQVLRVGTMIEGLKMHITDVQFTIPEGSNSWWPTFAGITKNSTVRTFEVLLGDDTTDFISLMTERRSFHSKSHPQSAEVEWAR
jgi:hypothetical protein